VPGKLDDPDIYAALSCVSERHDFLWWRKRSL